MSLIDENTKISAGEHSGLEFGCVELKQTEVIGKTGHYYLAKHSDVTIKSNGEYSAVPNTTQ
jgi:hypothetical protein